MLRRVVHVLSRVFLIAACSLAVAPPADAQIPGLPPLFPWLTPPQPPPMVPTPPATPPVPVPAPVPPPPPPVQPIFLGADISHPGAVDLAVLGPPGGTAVYYERLGTRRVRLGERRLGSFDENLLRKATAWRCDRLVRRFEADALGPDGARYTGTFSVRTPSCRNRFALSLPRRAARGQTVALGIRDTWRNGDARPRVCVGAPGARARCTTVALRAGQVTARHRIKITRTGKWKVRLRLGSARPLRTIEVGSRAVARTPPPAPRILATGDSTIQGVDGILADRLGSSAEVVGRLRPGTGISKPGDPSWLKTSRIQSSTLKPRATVVSLGVNDGFALRTPAGQRVQCCGEAWLSEYTRRVRIMMRTWTRFGGRVAWMTLPAPRVADLAPLFAAVNTSLSRAAVGLPRVTLVRVDLLFSPGGVPQTTVMRGGRRVPLHTSDGVHLSPAGTSIAADAVAAELRRSGVVR